MSGTFSLSERELLTIAAETPGVGLKAVCKTPRITLAYDTVRHSVQRLRKQGLLYAATPTWAILRPGWQGAWCVWEKQGSVRVAGQAVVAHLVGIGGADEQRGMIRDLGLTLRVTPVYASLRALRVAGVLWPWEGLVLTDAGAEVAVGRGLTVQKQQWRGAPDDVAWD